MSNLADTGISLNISTCNNNPRRLRGKSGPEFFQIHRLIKYLFLIFSHTQVYDMRIYIIAELREYKHNQHL